MKTKLIALILATILLLSGGLTILFSEVLFYDDINNSGLNYLYFYSNYPIPNSQPNLEQKVYLPKGDLEFEVEGNKINFKRILKKGDTYEPIVPLNESVVTLSTNVAYIVVGENNELIFYPFGLDQVLPAGEYELDDKQINQFFDLYTTKEVIEKYENSFWNDSMHTKRQIAFILGNVLLLLCIIVLYKGFKNDVKLYILLNVLGIGILVAMTILATNSFYIPSVMTPFGIFCWVVYILSFTALNFRKVRGSDPEEIFP